MTTTEIKTELRNELKNKGFKGFSISTKSFMSGNYIRVKANQDMERKALFHKICERYASIDRCERTYEILQGGNTFVDVQFGNTTYPVNTLCEMDGATGCLVTYYRNL